MTLSFSAKFCNIFITNPVVTTTKYTKVTSGTSCERIMSKEECERAAVALGLSDTTAYAASYSHSPPYCYYKGSNNNLYYNDNGNSAAQCTSERECLCKGGGKVS